MRLATWVVQGAQTFGVVTPDGKLYDIAKRSDRRICNLRGLIAFGVGDDPATYISGQPDGSLAAASLLPPIVAGQRNSASV